MTGSNGAVYAIPTAGEEEPTYAAPSESYDNGDAADVAVVVNGGTIYAVPQEQSTGAANVAVVANGDSLYAVPTEETSFAGAGAGADMAVVANFGKIYAIPQEQQASYDNADAGVAVVNHGNVEYAVPTEQTSVSVAATNGVQYTIPVEGLGASEGVYAAADEMEDGVDLEVPDGIQGIQGSVYNAAILGSGDNEV